MGFFSSLRNTLFGSGQWPTYFLINGTKIPTIINENTALNLSAYFDAVELLSNPFLTLPCKIYQQNGNNKKEAIENPAHYLLSRKANPWITASKFKKYIQQCKLNHGNGYAEIERNNRGEPIALWPIHPSKVKIETYSDGSFIYIITKDGNKNIGIEPHNMFHLSGYSDNGILGISVATFARDNLQLQLTTEQFANEYFENGVFPGGTITVPVGQKVDVEQLRKQLQETAGGANKHKPLVLTNGAELKSTSLSNRDMEFMSLRVFGIEEIARWFNLPPSKLKSKNGMTYNNIEQESLNFYTDSLTPHLIVFQDEVNDKLLNNEPDYYCKFNINALMWADISARKDYLSTAIDRGVYSPNEWRELDDLNPREGGDNYMTPLNMTTSNQDKNLDAFSVLLKDIFTRIENKHTKALTRYRNKQDMDAEAKFVEEQKDEIANQLNILNAAFQSTLPTKQISADICSNIKHISTDNYHSFMLEKYNYVLSIFNAA